MLRWFEAVPARRLAALRVYVGGFALVYLIGMLPMWLGYPRFHDRDFKPVGLAAVLVDEPVSAGAHYAVVAITIALAIAFTAGVLYRWLAPLFALSLLWLLSYRNSWGMVFHTENLLVIHTCVLALVPAADAWSWDARGKPAAPDGEQYGWPLRLCAALTTLTYLIAGLAKLRLGGWAWTSGEALRDQIAIDNLRKHLMGSPMSPIAAPLLAHPAIFEGLALTSLAVELGAPLALLHRRVAAVWAVMAWGFHAGVVALMAIVFPYPLSFIGYAPLFRCERPIDFVIERVRRRRARKPAGA